MTGRGSGIGTVVLPGARIGRHVTVGANSVVTGELPDYCVAAGAPGQGDPPLRRRAGLGEGGLVDCAVSDVAAELAGGMQWAMALPVVKSMTVLVTGLAVAPVISRYGSRSNARSRLCRPGGRR